MKSNVQTITAYLKRSPLPKYGSARILGNALIDYIVSNNLFVGDPFLSDNEIVALVGKSRSAVRRALELLQKDGWIDRVGGIGTFVGPRAKEATPNRRSPFSVKPPSDDKVIRFAAVTAGLKQHSRQTTNIHGWYVGQMLDSFSEAVAHDPVVLEYLGNHCSNPGVLMSRLKQCRPDLFLCIGPALNHSLVIGEAGRLGIPCLLAGVRMPEMGLPNIYENSRDASRKAVEHLVKLGHRRIGFVQVMSISAWWTFDRFEGYTQTMRKTGLERLQRLTLWLPIYESEESVALLDEYLERERPTAVIFGCSWAVLHLRQLVREGKYRIPDDFSVIVFDQHPQVEDWLGGTTPTTIELPLKLIGHKMAEYGKRIIAGENVPKQVPLECALVEGRSTDRPFH